MPRRRQAEGPPRVQPGQSTIEFALVLPLLVLCTASLVTVLSVCIAVLDLNDTARILARAASGADDPAVAAAELAASSGVRATTRVDAASGIITVNVTTAVRPWFLGARLPSLTIRSSSMILGEPQVILGQ